MSEARRRDTRLPVVGISTGHSGLRTHRTLSEAFGPAARYHGLESSRSSWIDRVLNVSAVLVAIATVAVIAWQVMR